MQTEDKKQPTLHTREMLAPQIETPPKDIVHDMWWRAQRAPGRLIQLPIEAPGCEKMFLTVETQADGERPMWTLYAGDGATARVLWNYVLSDVEMIQEIVALSVSSGSQSAVFENSAPQPARESTGACPEESFSEVAAFDVAPRKVESTPWRETPVAQEKPAAPQPERKNDDKPRSSPEQKAPQQNAPNIMLGNILVDAGLMPQPLLEASLKLQEMVRKTELTPDQATDVLRKMHTRGVGMQEVIAEMKRRRQEKPPEDAVELLREAGVVSEQDVIKAKHVLLQLRKAGLESDKGNEIAQSLLDLLRLAGFISDEDIRRAAAASSSRSTEICKTLLNCGTVDALSFEVGSRFVKYMRVGRFRQEQAVIAMHYSQRCRTGFEETVHSLGWQVPIES